MTPAVTTRDIPVHPPQPSRSRTLALVAAGGITLLALLVLTFALQHATQTPAPSPHVVGQRPPAPAVDSVPAPAPTPPEATPTPPEAAPPPLPTPPPVAQSLQTSEVDAGTRRHRHDRVPRDTTATRPTIRRTGTRVERTQRGGFIIR
jgi:hypothetical protein